MTVDADQRRRDLVALLVNEAMGSRRKPAREAALWMARDMLDDPERGHLKPENFTHYISAIARKMARLSGQSEVFRDAMQQIADLAEDPWDYYGVRSAEGDAG